MNLEDMREVLREHRYQEAPPPGLYPYSPTVCSCGSSPQKPPSDDYDWWVWHATLIAFHRDPIGYRRNSDGEWERTGTEEYA